MLNRLSGFLLFVLMVALLTVVALNFRTLLNAAQAQLVASSAQDAMATGSLDRAIVLYENGLRAHPRNPEIALQLGSLYLRANKPEQAEQLYQSIIQADPANLDAQIALAQLYQASPERFNSAVETYRKALKARPDSAELLYRIGSLYKAAAENPQETRQPVQKWLYDQARYYYQWSLKRDPKQFHALFNLGVAYQQRENMQPAAKAYCQAIVLNPDSYEAHFNLGMILSELNYLDEAYRQLDQAVKLASSQAGGAVAMQVAQRVQRIKSNVYNDTEKRGLSGSGKPDFLNPQCLFATTHAETAQTQTD